MILNYANIFQGGDIEDLQVPVGGDQLTRVRLQGAKDCGMDLLHL